MSSCNKRDSSTWLVSVPLGDLLAMQNSMDELETMKQENAKLRSRMEGLHRTLYDLMEVVQDLRKGVPASRGA